MMQNGFLPRLIHTPLLLLAAAVLHTGGPLAAQVPDAPTPAAAPATPAPAPAPAPAAEPAPAAPAAKPTETGNDPNSNVPFFDPGTEVLTWNGRSWNVSNNRLFQARFEKYLNAPEATSQEDRNYQAILAEILRRLAPGNATTENIDIAFRLLPRGSSYDTDARLCDALADSVYSAWLAQRAQARLVAARTSLEQERRGAHWDATNATAGNSMRTTHTKGKGNVTTMDERSVMIMQDRMKRVAELEAQLKVNSAKRELFEIQAKVEFQALIVQFFLQRRFQHVLMATRFYRAVFSDGDTKLNVGEETRDLFAKSTGMPPTVSTLDSMANEAMRDVREGVKAYDFLLQNNELESATKRLAEAFTVGEYLPEIRTLPRPKKRQALEFAQKSNQLISALEVKDFTLAEGLVKELAVIAKDFDNSKPLALIEGTKTTASFRLAQARNAALRGDRKALETELTEATKLWPRNPALAELSRTIFTQGDIHQQALLEFDQLLGQKNFRQIFENSPRFIAAMSIYPEKQPQLKQVLGDMQTIETAIMRAEEMQRQNNSAGAWESVEKVAENFPTDSKLNLMRADLTTQAADFVRTIRGAQDLEKKEQVGSSLAWFLKAQKLYPASEFANSGVERLTKKILPPAQ